MNRRKFVSLLVGGPAMWPLGARAQQGSAMPVVGFLHASSPDGYALMVAAFLRGLQEVGYIDSQKQHNLP